MIDLVLLLGIKEKIRDKTGNMDHLALGFIWYAVFLFSTVFHEAAHSWVAFKLGDPTAYEGGQASLNPIPHIQRSPFGMVLVPSFTFYYSHWMMGWASAPYDPRWAYAHPRKAGWMSLAGPVANLILVLAASLLIRVGMVLGVFVAPFSVGFSHVVTAAQAGPYTELATLLSVFFSLNLLLFCFNLLPLPPLDGSGAAALFIPKKLAEKYLVLIHNPQIQFISFIVAWKLFGYVFLPIQTVALDLLYPGSSFGY